MTKIISGQFRGRKLVSAGDKITRPTMQRTREAIFNSLMHNDFERGFSLTGSRVLDVFAGTGAYGIEALSRGAEHVTMIEKNAKACQAIRANIDMLSLNDCVTLNQKDAFKIGGNNKEPYDIAFFDPPYDLDLMPSVLQLFFAEKWLSLSTVLVVETRSSGSQSDLSNIDIFKNVTYGESRVVFGGIKVI